MIYKVRATVRWYFSLPRSKAPIFTSDEWAPMWATIAAVATVLLCGFVRGF